MHQTHDKGANNVQDQGIRRAVGYNEERVRILARLDNRGIKSSKEEMVDATVTAMWDSKFFTREQMTTWERLDDVDKTMMNVKMYFTGAYKDLMQYSRATASKRTWFGNSASNIKQEPTNESRAEQPSEPTEEQNNESVMFAFMQKQHNNQLNQMKESQAAAIKNNKAMM